MISSLIFVSFLTTSIISLSNNVIPQRLVEQHPNVLVDAYNECSHVSTPDDESKSWFSLNQSGQQHHFPHSTDGVSTIKYHVSNTSLYNPTLTWDYNMPNGYLGDEVKQNLVNSILKWNRIYFYSYSTTQVLTKKKLVNIIEGNSSDYDVIIHPEKTIYMYYSGSATIPASAAEASTRGFPSYYMEENGILHRHYNNWDIALNLESNGINTTNNNYHLNRIGAHEFGHVLGLRDIDIEENVGNHHSELLMGYADMPQAEITYKDLVGVAITRGYHTDLDHQWMYDSNNSSEGNYKLICSICNGIKYVTSLNNLSYVNYKACNNEHDVEYGNMVAVASYDDTDYYKCKYCKYVAPFGNRIAHNYSASQFNTFEHLVSNQVIGLEYSFYESHNYGFSYDWRNNTTHYSNCMCGDHRLEGHIVSPGSIVGGSQYATCLLCGGLAKVGFIGPLNLNDLQKTNNGSYILPNGVIALCDEDIESYLNGTLVFSAPTLLNSL